MATKKRATKKAVKKIPKKNKKEEYNDKKLISIIGIVMGFLILGGIFLDISGTMTGYDVLDDAVAGSNIAKNTANIFGGEILKPLFEFLLGESSSGEYFFAKVLFLIFMFGFLLALVRKVEFFKEHSFLGWLFAFTVSYLTMRALGQTKVFETLLLPYTALGVAFGTLGVFAAWFIIVNKGLKKSPPMIRKFLWILLGIALIIFSWVRKDLYPLNWIYIASGIASGIMVLLDATIKKIVYKMENEEIIQGVIGGPLLNLTDELDQIANQFSKGAMTHTEFEQRRRNIMRRREVLQR